MKISLNFYYLCKGFSTRAVAFATAKLAKNVDIE